MLGVDGGGEGYVAALYLDWARGPGLLGVVFLEWKSNGFNDFNYITPMSNDFNVFNYTTSPPYASRPCQQDDRMTRPKT